jgi:hypothetical protein
MNSFFLKNKEQVENKYIQNLFVPLHYLSLLRALMTDTSDFESARLRNTIYFLQVIPTEENKIA